MDWEIRADDLQICMVIQIRRLYVDVERAHKEQHYYIVLYAIVFVVFQTAYCSIFQKLVSIVPSFHELHNLDRSPFVSGEEN